MLPWFVLFCFIISWVSVLRFVQLRPGHWLEVLITCILLTEVFSMLRQNWVVTGLRHSYSPLDWRCCLVAKHLSHMLSVPGLDPQHHSEQNQLRSHVVSVVQAGAVCVGRGLVLWRVSCQLQDSIHFRSFSFCTWSHCCLQALQPVDWATPLPPVFPPGAASAQA
jgi:hypothetical protein